MAKIHFDFGGEEDLGEFADHDCLGITVWQHVWQLLLKPDELVIQQSEIVVVVDYPLSGKFEFVRHSLGGWTRLQLLSEIVKLYRYIYRKDAEAVFTCKYGVYGGNSIDDLVLEGIKITKKGKVKLMVGS